MDVDNMKPPSCDTNTNTNNNMDMMAMMMQIEKFPEFCDPFYTSTTTIPSYQETELLSNASSTTSVSTIFNNVTSTPPTLIDPNVNFSNNNNNNLIQQQPLTTLQVESPPNASYPYTSEKKNSMAAMREMIFRIAVMQPIHIDPESVKPPKRRNVKISKDPQSVAARHRRERISERIRILQRLVPGGTKMDTASMLDEAIHYVKFLKKQVQTLEQAGANNRPHSSNQIGAVNVGFPLGMSNINSSNNVSYSSLLIKGCQPCHVFGSTSKQLLS